MKLSLTQNRFINNKSMGFTILKGKTGSGKTTASIYRALNLENNYCIQENDNILFVSNNDIKLEAAKNNYNTLKDENHFYSLFSMELPRVEFSNMSNLINSLFNSLNNTDKEVINRNEIKRLINNQKFNRAYFEFSTKSKAINKMDFDLLLDEIAWIKASNLSFQDYMIIQRKSRKPVLRKNSIAREFIYELKELYNKQLVDNGYIDIYDKAIVLLNGNLPSKKYFHIIIDDAETFTRAELELLKGLCRTDLGTSITYILNTDPFSYREHSWLVKGVNIKTLLEKHKSKVFNFKTTYNTVKQEKEDFMESYKYINLKNKNIVEFNIDTYNPKKELYTKDNETYIEDELEEVPIYTEIAAGNPIEINEDILGNFSLPKGWLERGKSSFILGVKGNSMIEKDICDGDYVVVKKQATANNNDIVAASVDGEATLKTLKLDKEQPMLMPANKNFSPIYIQNKEVSILGVVIGVIKHKN